MKRSAITERIEVHSVAAAAAPTSRVSTRHPAIDRRLVDCLVACASWVVICAGAGVAAAILTRELGSVTYIPLGAYLAIVGSLTHCALLTMRKPRAAAPGGSWLQAWVASLTVASLLLGFLVIRHPQHDWVVRAFANLWMTFAAPTAAVCAGVATYLVRSRRQKRLLLLLTARASQDNDRGA